MSFRHEDYPCCGCGQSIHPDLQTEETCYGCQQANTVDRMVKNSYGVFYKCPDCKWSGDDQPEEFVCPECGSDAVYEDEAIPMSEEEAWDVLADRMDDQY